MVGSARALVLMRDWRSNAQRRSDGAEERSLRIEAWIVAALMLLGVIAAAGL